MTPHVLGHLQSWGLRRTYDVAYDGVRTGTNTGKYNRSVVNPTLGPVEAHWSTLESMGAITAEDRERLNHLPAEVWPGAQCKTICVAANFVHAGSVSNWRGETLPVLTDAATRPTTGLRARRQRRKASADLADWWGTTRKRDGRSRSQMRGPAGLADEGPEASDLRFLRSLGSAAPGGRSPGSEVVVAPRRGRGPGWPRGPPRALWGGLVGPRVAPAAGWEPVT